MGISVLSILWGVSAPEGIPEAILFGAKDYYAT